jgi:hypothetical protein
VDGVAVVRTPAPIPVHQDQEREQPFLVPRRTEEFQDRIERHCTRGAHQSAQLGNPNPEKSIALPVLPRPGLEKPLEDSGGVPVAQRCESASQILQIRHGFLDHPGSPPESVGARHLPAVPGVG